MDNFNSDDSIVKQLKTKILQNLIKKNVVETTKLFIQLIKHRSMEYYWNLIWYFYMRFVGMQYNPLMFVWLFKQYSNYNKYIRSKKIQSTTDILNDYFCQIIIAQCISVITLSEKHMKIISTKIQKSIHQQTQSDIFTISSLIKFRLTNLISSSSNHSLTKSEKEIVKHLSILLYGMDLHDPDKLFLFISGLCKSKFLDKKHLIILFEYFQKYLNRQGHLKLVINSGQDLCLLLLETSNSYEILKYILYEFCMFVKIVDTKQIILKNKENTISLNEIILHPTSLMNTLIIKMLIDKNHF
jgi:hypothetical protein